MSESQNFLSPAAMHGLLDDVGDGVLLTDTEENVIYLNPAASAILGCPEDLPLWTRFSDICPLVNVQTGASYSSPIGEVVENCRPAGLARNIGILRGQEKTPIYLSATCSPLEMSDGRVYGCTIILRDVTHMRKREIALEDKAKSAANAGTFKRISEELDTPLKGMMNMLDLALHMELTSGQRAMLENVRRCGQNIEKVLEGYLKDGK